MNAILAANAARSVTARATYARLAEVSKTLRSTAEQAAVLGVATVAMATMRKRARAAGFDVLGPVRSTTTNFAAESAKLAAFDALMEGPGCDRCGLRGPHLCVEAGLVHLATSRPGEGFSPSRFDDLDVPSSKRLEPVSLAAVRHGMDRRIMKLVLAAAGHEKPAGYRWSLHPEVIDAAVAKARKVGLPKRKSGSHRAGGGR